MDAPSQQNQTPPPLAAVILIVVFALDGAASPSCGNRGTCLRIGMRRPPCSRWRAWPWPLPASRASCRAKTTKATAPAASTGHDQNGHPASAPNVSGTISARTPAASRPGAGACPAPGPPTTPLDGGGAGVLQTGASRRRCLSIPRTYADSPVCRPVRIAAERVGGLCVRDLGAVD